MNCCGLRERLQIGKHKHLAVGTRLHQPIGVCYAVEREAAEDIADDRRALRGQGQCVRDETGKLVESFDPTHAVVFGDEDGRGKKLVEVDGRYRAGQLTIVDQAAARCEELQAGLVRRSADRVKNSGHSVTACVCANGVPHILGIPVDHVVGPGSAHAIHPLAAGDADDIDTAIGQNSHQHSTHCPGGAPHAAHPRRSSPGVMQGTARPP